MPTSMGMGFMSKFLEPTSYISKFRNWLKYSSFLIATGKLGILNLSSSSGVLPVCALPPSIWGIESAPV